MLELHLVDHAYERLRCLPDVSVGREVPLLGRYVDLVYVRNNHVITVEFKLRDWRRAVRQASDHLLGADYSFVCIPPRQVTAPLRHAIQEAGLGLCLFESQGSWPFDVLIPAPPSQETWQVARQNVLHFLAAGGR